MTEPMTRDEAKKILARWENSEDMTHDEPEVSRAYGYLEADTQWQEKARPLVEALEKLYSIIEHKRPAWTNEEMRWIAEARKALSDFNGGGK